MRPLTGSAQAQEPDLIRVESREPDLTPVESRAMTRVESNLT
jgi:hypothetical protein